MRKNKEHKGHESTIGKIIYGFMLFAPLLAILSAVLVNTFNVKKETETEVQIQYKYETNDVSSVDDLIVGNIYTFHIDTNISSIQEIMLGENSFIGMNIISSDKITNFTDLAVDEIMYQYTLDSNSYGITTLYANYFSNYLILYGSEYQFEYMESLLTVEFFDLTNEDDNSDVFNIDFILLEFNDINLTNDVYISKCENIPIENVIITEEEYKTKDIFYTAINDVEKSNLFNWSKNSIIYTGIAETCETLSINNTFIPMLLAYWLIMSILYFLYDIILMILQILHKKIHELQDSF